MAAVAASSVLSMASLAISLVAGIIALTTDNHRTAAWAYATGILSIALSVVLSTIIILMGTWA